MYESGVKILPDQTGLNQSLDRLNQTRLGILQQDVAETQKGIDEFKQIIDKSFIPVYGKYQQAYTQKREDFLKEAADMYRKKNGRLSQQEYMNVSSKLQELADYANTANLVRKTYNDAVMSVVSDTDNKFNRTETFNNLKKIENLDLYDAKDYLESGKWISIAPKDVDFSKIAKGIKENLVQKTGKIDIQPDGSAIRTEGEEVDLDKAKLAVEQYWESNSSLHNDYTKNAFVNGVMMLISPGWKRESGYTRPPSDGSGKTPISVGKIKNRGNDTWDIETLGKKISCTLAPNMEIYTDDKKPVILENASDGDIIGFEKRNFGMGKQLYAKVKAKAGTPESMFVLKQTPSEGRKEVTENKEIVYVPMNRFDPQILKKNNIILEEFNQEESNIGDVFDGFDVNGILEE